MSDEIKDKDGLEEEISADSKENEQNDDTSTQHSDYKPVNRFDASAVHHLSGMYQNWFLDYASYVILERAVPHIEDGLKPVQRRILHSMKRMDDGRYNKVANIVGHTMQFHPHGDASIGDALVQMGQKDLSSTHRATGETSSPATVPLPLVISRLVFQNSHSTWSSTRRPPTGNSLTMVVTRSLSRSLPSSRCSSPKVLRVSPWD